MRAMISPTCPSAVPSTSAPPRRASRTVTSRRSAAWRSRAVALDPFADPAPPREDLPDSDWCERVVVGRGSKHSDHEGDTLVVRAFTREDVPDVAALLLGSGMSGFPTERRTLEVYLAGAIGAFPFGTYLVGVLNGEVVATVGVSFNADTRRKFTTLAPPVDEAYLSDLTVLEERRGGGLGVAMLRGAEAFARAMKSDEMWLHVALKKPKVCALYADNGYSVAGIDPGLFGWRGRLLMRRKMFE
jgi:ribosomal protein S18 acetylase RimI-like enzyme|uniref:N-acetyltransferase domain-containing protein n=1 Tax=Ostreococcus mediterraneus TaxID=1486918 RepID=A0A7S0KLC7_9CHLO